MRFALLCLLAGCGGSAKPATAAQPALVDPAPGPAKVVDCAAAVDHVLTKITPGGVPVKAMSDIHLVRCAQDVWSPGARSCMATAMSHDQGQSCYDRELTNDQRKRLADEMLAAFGDQK